LWHQPQTQQRGNGSALPYCYAMHTRLIPQKINSKLEFAHEKYIVSATVHAWEINTCTLLEQIIVEYSTTKNKNNVGFGE